MFQNSSDLLYITQQSRGGGRGEKIPQSNSSRKAYDIQGNDLLLLEPQSKESGLHNRLKNNIHTQEQCNAKLNYS